MVATGVPLTGRAAFAKASDACADVVAAYTCAGLRMTDLGIGRQAACRLAARAGVAAAPDPPADGGRTPVLDRHWHRWRRTAERVHRYG